MTESQEKNLKSPSQKEILMYLSQILIKDTRLENVHSFSMSFFPASFQRYN